MGAWTSSVATIVDTLAKKNGRYDERTPKMKPSDLIAVLGLFSRGLPPAIDRIATAGAQRSDWVTAEGLWTAPSSAQLFASQDTLATSDYLFKTTAPTTYAPWRRVPGKLTDAQVLKAKIAGVSPSNVTYEPARMPSSLRNDQTELVSFLRQTIADYQRALDNATLAVTMYPGTVASSSICKSFMSAIRSLAADLEVLQENPPTTYAQDIKGALGAALDASEEAVVSAANAAGSAAAWVGNAAGKVAGSAAAGFFSTANMATLLVAGVVGVVALKKAGIV